MKQFLARQPLVARAVVVIALVAILRIAALLGWIPPDWVLSEDRVQDGIDGVLGLLAVWSAHRAVTPVAAPRNNEGQALAPTRIFPGSRGL
ncbi:hypothetical protein AB0C10_21295 [Microbispora amethystogenes]|uniref:hypothetical protein n=1 Tax=Microbispora amethystogenes TaxID=1427754 RepID=UPI0033F48C73